MTEYNPAEINEAIELAKKAIDYISGVYTEVSELELTQKEYERFIAILSSLKVIITDGDNGGKDE